MASRGVERTRLDGGSHEGFLRHRKFRWLKVAVLLSLITTIVYLMVDIEPRHNGGSWLGYTLGTIGAVLILWLTMLGLRKRAMTRGKWSLKAWTSAHVYLGLSLIVIATLHTGFQFGWNVHTLAYSLMMLVILSGIYGISAYATLPDELSDTRGSMTRPQMLEATQQLDRQLQAAAQPLGTADTEIVQRSIEEDPFRGGIVRRIRGRYGDCGNALALARMRARFEDATPEEEKALETVIDLLERKETALGRLRRHLRVRALLEAWLYVHVPLTFALIAALAAHIVSVFFYW
jgi:hypothetical protein